MSTIATQLFINRFSLPEEIIDIIKEYIFHKIKKIQKNDERYQLLLTIPYKEYDYTDDSTFVYMRISDEKDYFLVYTNFVIQLQTLRYGDDNVIYFVEGSQFLIE
jgi:hypothetical protein